MLCLTRRLGEEIKIGCDVVVTVLEIRGDKVRLGVHAPDDVLILRGELTPYDLRTEEGGRDDR